MAGQDPTRDYNRHEREIEALREGLKEVSDGKFEVDKAVFLGLNDIDRSLHEIRDDLGKINDKLDEPKAYPHDMSPPHGSSPNRGDPDGPVLPPPAPDSLEAELERGLHELAGVPRARARRPAFEAADEIRRFMRDNDSAATEQEVAQAIAGMPVAGIVDPPSYANAVFNIVAKTALEPGRNLPHRLAALERARSILAHAGINREPSAQAPASCAQPPCAQPTSTIPAAMSSEVLRDVSHLTTLLLGASPAFAEAMRMQSDAIAYSLAEFNKVGDMQRQDSIALAITASAAAKNLDRR